MDMINRLPGFEFNDGTSARGFAGTAGNVLIDGQRPTSKTDDVQSILTRLPASDVDQIDIIRGGAPGIDMQGQTVIANVIRKTGDSTQIVADVEDNFWPDGHSVPNGSLEITNASPARALTKRTLTRYGNFDDFCRQRLVSRHRSHDRRYQTLRCAHDGPAKAGALSTAR